MSYKNPFQFLSLLVTPLFLKEYRSFPLFISNKVTLVDLVKLDKMYFDAIGCIDFMLFLLPLIIH